MLKTFLDLQFVVDVRHLGINFCKNPHRRVGLLGLLILLTYSVRWLWLWLEFTLSGSTFPLLVLTALWIGSSTLWLQRSQVSALVAFSGSHRLGNGLIFFGTALFLVIWQYFWLQAVSAIIVLVGIALSIWGIRFFRVHWFPVLLILFSVHPGLYPKLTTVLWQAITPPHTLEKFMAWAGAATLRLVGYSATSNDISIQLPTQAVDVLWACTGFELVLTMIGISVLAGIVFHLHWLQTFSLAILGSIFSLSLNVIRIALMTLAAVFWGEQSFEFWHGPWGGQVFALIVFTLYYYLFVWILSWRTFQGAEKS